MKKLLISILIVLLLILSVFIAVKGLSIGGFKVLGISGIKDKNAELDSKVEEATRLASTDFKRAIGQVQENAKKLTEEKNKYEEMALLNTNEEGQLVTQIQKYEIETLWVKLGNYATSEGATLKIELTTGSSGATDSYNLKFTVNGSYISITDLISDIENDTTLGFKIEDFKLTPSGGTDNLQATFVCKDITIVDVNNSVSNISRSDQDTNTTDGTNENSNTNTTNSTQNSNTTNTSSVTNATNTNNTINTTNTTNTNSAQ